MKELLYGNEAIARGAYEAGVTVATAYPGTPSTEVTENIALYDEIYAEWSSNEKVALEVAIGSAIAGARSICSMKQVGLNVAADPLFTNSYTGINGGLVIVVADDPGIHSSQNEQDTRLYALASKIPLLEPSDSQECKDYVIKAFELSEKFDTPVIIRITTRIAHSKSLVEIGDRTEYIIKDYKKNVEKYVMMPAMARKSRVTLEKKIGDLSYYSDISSLNNIEYGDNEFGIITSGIAYQYTKEALGNVSVLKLGLVYPLPEQMIIEFASKVKKLYIVEELEPFIENQVKKMGINTIGKVIFPLMGELSSQIIKEKILGIKTKVKSKHKGELPKRPPVMCPGCPHRPVFYVLNKLKMTVSGDIGCYTLGALTPEKPIDTVICMGASIGVLHGMEKARGKDFIKKAVAIIGDSTFIHSGITGLIDIVYNKGISTVIILDNSVTAMTGHQHNPATGFTIKGEVAKRVDLEKISKAIGIERVKTVNPFKIEEFERIIKEECEVEEPSLVIARKPCVLIDNTKSEVSLKINKRKCKKCNLCLSVGCPAIIKKQDEIEINSLLCVGCNLCYNLCPFGAIEMESEKNG